MLTTRRSTLRLAFALGLVVPWSPLAATPSAHALVTRALTGTTSEQDQAIAVLRGLGPAGVERVLAAEPAGAGHEGWERVLDRVCAQRDCAASRLYWYTDLDQALAAAERTQRPIVSLRLLGRLDEEVSCANSRFFRTVLYADPAVGALLRDEVVLHWESVRPVPRLTIDFGDGRTLEGTVTGNSLHYVLDRHGRVVDALPGLYGAGPFLDALRPAVFRAQEAGRLDDSELASSEDWQRLDDLGRFAGELRPYWGATEDRPWGPPTAIEASFRATSKSAFERPVLQALSLGSWRDELAPLDWTALAAAIPRERLLSEPSRSLLVRKHRATAAGAAADPLRVVEGFLELLAADTVRNEYLLRPVLRSWLTEGEPIGPDGLAALTERIYAELFLTPSSDPWLGLVSAETYLALEESSRRGEG